MCIRDRRSTYANLGEQCAKECTYTYDASLTTCNQAVSDVTKNTYGAQLDACANIASGVMDDCMVSVVCPLRVSELQRRVFCVWCVYVPEVLLLCCAAR